jgi:hypothetical protein
LAEPNPDYPCDPDLLEIVPKDIFLHKTGGLMVPLVFSVELIVDHMIGNCDHVEKGKRGQTPFSADTDRPIH